MLKRVSENLDLISDVHLECYSDPLSVFQKIIQGVELASTLVIAGDFLEIVLWDSNKDLFRFLEDSWDNIIYVMGNHEYYRTSYSYSSIKIQDFKSKFSKIKFLSLGNSFTLNDEHYFGSTMWFNPFTTEARTNRKYLNDFYCIEDADNLIKKHNDHFQEKISEITSETIVITHHLPTYRSVPLKYVGSPINCFYVNPMEDLILEKQPKLWLHGHTHKPCDTKIGSTRIIANPFGYPNETEANSAHFKF